MTPHSITHLNSHLDTRHPMSLEMLLVLISCITLLVTSGCERASHAPKSGTSSRADSTRDSSRVDSSSPVIAQVGEVRLTEADVQRRLNDLSPITRARYQQPERRQELLSSMIRFELLAAEARRLGYHQRPEVQLTYKQAMVRELLGREVRELVKMSDISEDEVRSYYQDHLSDYERPELTRASHILFKTEAEASAALKQLKLQITAKPQDARVLFGDLAAAQSVDQETKARRGDLQYFTRDGEGYGERRFPQSPVPAEVARLAFGLKSIGELVSAPAQSSRGWHLIQRTGGKRAFKRPLSEVRTEIRNTLFRARKGKALEDYVAQLKAGVKINTYTDRLNAIKLSAESAPPLPNLQGSPLLRGAPLDPRRAPSLKIPTPPGASKSSTSPR